MKINGKEVKHITIRNENDDDIIYIGEEEIINQSNRMSICLTDENFNEIKINRER